MHLHLQWSGPFTYAEAIRLRNEQTDYGVYQIYGAHPIYGADVLIYIGKADRQTFGQRLSQETWGEFNQDASRVKVYVGRLNGYNGTPAEDDWSKQISVVERLLIYAHWPAANSSGLNVKFDGAFHDLHVLNWGTYRDLLPEVSGARYSDLYDSDVGYAPYGSQTPTG